MRGFMWLMNSVRRGCWKCLFVDTPEDFTGTSSYSTMNDDDSCSTTTETMLTILPNGRLRRRIMSWTRGVLLGNGFYGMVHGMSESYGLAADIWSIGCTVLEMLTRQIPYPNLEWSGCFIKTLRSDRGKEYTFKEFHNFCEDEGVERQLTVRYTPQQNGVTERKNQTIVEMAKSMMHEKGLPKIFWAEAVYTAVYLSNRCPTTAIPKIFWDENALWNWEENKVEKKDILISTDKEDEIEPSTPDSSSSQPNDESSTDPTSSNSSSPSTTPKRYRSLDDIYATCNYCSIDPENFDEAIKEESWKKAMQEEVRVIEKNQTWELVDKPTDKEVIAKRVLRYVQGTTDLGLSFQKNHALNLVGYCDSDLGGSLDDMKSTSGYCFSFGSATFSWLSKKQQSVAQSSAEAEYISASVATSQAIWLRRILGDLGHHQIEGTVLYCDNKSAIAMAKNPVHHSRTRHIALKYHFIRQTIEDKEIQLEFCRSEEQLSDIFAKALPRERFEQLRAKLEIR
ncbi:hypothetical protein ZIOFF_017458 [Zingiber officinale]|uniref:Integrase catalytic domain-containing protein n=1 Tax=Zingiber officinale TaxID=94328 RepID=A0A8J5LJ34_ZINOF|nr:hypothetical protein ZIOFF_017458 [Zingiber officinale]